MHMFVTNTKQFKIINNDAKKHLGTVKTVKCVVSEFRQHSLANDRYSCRENLSNTQKTRCEDLERGETIFQRKLTEDDPFSYSS